MIAALDIIRADTSHPVVQVSSAAGTSRIIRVSSNQIIGYIIPLLCIGLLLVWAIYVAVTPRPNHAIQLTPTRCVTTFFYDQNTSTHLTLALGSRS